MAYLLLIAPYISVYWFASGSASYPSIIASFGYMARMTVFNVLIYNTISLRIFLIVRNYFILYHSMLMSRLDEYSEIGGVQDLQILLQDRLRYWGNKAGGSELCAATEVLHLQIEG